MRLVIVLPPPTLLGHPSQKTRWQMLAGNGSIASEIRQGKADVPRMGLRANIPFSEHVYGTHMCLKWAVFRFVPQLTDCGTRNMGILPARAADAG